MVAQDNFVSVDRGRVEKEAGQADEGSFLGASISSPTPQLMRRKRLEEEIRQLVGSRCVIISDGSAIEVYPDRTMTRRPGGVGTAYSQVLSILGMHKGVVIHREVEGARTGALTLQEVRSLIRAGEFPEALCQVNSVVLSQAEYVAYYEDVSNTALWRFFHGLSEYRKDELGSITIDGMHEKWAAYLGVSRKMACEAVSELGPDSGMLLFNDYQLISAPKFAREEMEREGKHSPIGFFFHIPFPEPDVFFDPECFQANELMDIVEGFLGADFIGFQTEGDVENFIRVLEDSRSWELDVYVENRPNGNVPYRINYEGRVLLAAAVPISIDPDEVQMAVCSEVGQRATQALEQQFPNELRFVSIGRLDFTKGFREEVEAVDQLLREHGEHLDLLGNVRFILMGAKSRETLAPYKKYREILEERIAEINDKYRLMCEEKTGRSDWEPISFEYKNTPPDAVYGYFRAADGIILIPLADGMNLMVKEAFSIMDESRARPMILSSGAGASIELGDCSYLVDASNCDSIVAGIRQAIQDRRDSPETVILKGREGRKRIYQNTILDWTRSFVYHTRTAYEENEIRNDRRTRSFSDSVQSLYW